MFCSKGREESVAILASLRVNVGALVKQQPDDLCLTAP
jgi:hypothetical protein